MSIVIARIYGGIGNQLFCYAAARRMSIMSGSQLIIDDISGFVKDGYGRSYQLNKFSIKSPTISAHYNYYKLNSISRFFLRNFSKIRLFENNKYIYEKSLSFDQRILNYSPKGVVYLDGYWQSEKYFMDVEKNIREDLQIPAPSDLINRSIFDRINSSNSIAVHVRFFGSYRAENQLIIQKRYYENAISYFENQNFLPHYFIFSDNPSRALELIDWPRSRFTIIDNNSENPVFDLWLMSKCANFIIANSTFSWWGAWLSRVPGKVVIAPKFNLGSDVSAWGFDGLIPDTWKCI